MTPIESIQALIDMERTAMCEKHQQQAFNSPHEKYAVLKEEWEEAQIEMEKALQAKQLLWAAAKINNQDLYNESADLIKIHAIQAIQELIQVAACCDKPIKGKTNEVISSWGN